MDNLNYNPFSIVGKTILVTGASSGIGCATAIECSRMGAKVVLSARNQERLEQTLSMMDGTDHLIIQADLANEDDIHALAKEIPQLNGIVSVAGTACLKPQKYYSISAVESTFAVKTFSGMYLIRELLRGNKICNDASLVFVSSITSSYVPINGNGIYSSSKAATEAFSRQCALELAARGIRSNTINPGAVLTELLKSNSTYSEDDVVFDKISLFKRFEKPEEIALSAGYLLSDASSFVTGTSIVIDGGLHINYR